MYFSTLNIIIIFSDLIMKEFYIFLVSLVVNVVVVNSNKDGEKETFTEELYLKPLPNGDLLAHFSFDITSANDLQDHSSKDSKDFLTHFNLMPKVVGEFLTDHALEGITLTCRKIFFHYGDFRIN